MKPVPPRLGRSLFSSRAARVTKRQDLERVVVVGTSGSGKTTLARRLADVLGCPHVELDFHHFEPEWRERSDEDFRQRVAEAIMGPRWVVDGNYSATRDLIWPRATRIIWLNYSFGRTFGRVLGRTIRRSVTREVLWAGNRERLVTTLFSRDSILLWVILTYRRRRREYGALRDPAHPRSDALIEFTKPRQAEMLLRSLEEPGS